MKPAVALLLKKKNVIIACMLFLDALFIFIFIFPRIPRNSLEVEDQKTGPFIIIKKLFLTKPGFVAVVAANKYKKMGGKIVGNHPYLFAPGTYTNIQIAKFESQGGLEATKPLELDEQTPKGRLFFAVIYEDSDNNNTLSSGDHIMPDWFGREITKSFIVSR